MIYTLDNTEMFIISTCVSALLGIVRENYHGAEKTEFEREIAAGKKHSGVQCASCARLGAR